MKKIIIAFLILSFFSGICFAADKVLSSVEIFKQSSKAIGVIRTFDKSDRAIGLGSTFVVRSNGILLTNHHVLTGAYKAKVYLSGVTYEVLGVVDYDKDHDIVCIKVDAASLPTMPLGDSDKVSVAERVYAIGSPVGLENTISEGIVSAVREFEKYKLIQTSAPISPGSSGGPLINEQGEVIGIIAVGIRGAGTEALNFAVPINYAKPKIGDEVKHDIEEVALPLRGVMLTNVYGINYGASNGRSSFGIEAGSVLGDGSISLGGFSFSGGEGSPYFSFGSLGSGGEYLDTYYGDEYELYVKSIGKPYGPFSLSMGLGVSYQGKTSVYREWNALFLEWDYDNVEESFYFITYSLGFTYSIYESAMIELSYHNRRGALIGFIYEI